MQLHREKKKKTDSKSLKLKNALKCLEQYLSLDTLAFTESQVAMSKQRYKQAYRWNPKNKMLALAIFFHSKKAYKILSQLFILPSKSTLLYNLQKMNIQPGLNESVLEALMSKAQAMYDRDHNVALAFDEMTIKQGLVYKEGSDTIEGFEGLVILVKQDLSQTMLLYLWSQGLLQNGNN